MENSETYARERDAADPLRGFRERFHLPLTGTGEPFIYLTGNSLGLQPKNAREYIEQELSDWAGLAVDGHLNAKHPWFHIMSA